MSKDEYIVEEKNIGDYTIKIYPDEDADSPREWSNIGTMICFHSRYNLGDKHSYNFCDYDSWEDMKEHIIKDEDIAVILPLYLFDHSDISISTEDFGDRWDSGQIGWIVASKEKLREEYICKRITEKIKEKCITYLKGEVEIYDQYLRGDVYGFKVFDTDDEEIDSCWGYYGTESAIEEATSVIEHLMKNL